MLLATSEAARAYAALCYTILYFPLPHNSSRLSRMSYHILCFSFLCEEEQNSELRQLLSHIKHRIYLLYARGTLSNKDKGLYLQVFHAYELVEPLDLSLRSECDLRGLLDVEDWDVQDALLSVRRLATRLLYEVCEGSDLV
jgi:hypothetical protein